MYGSGYLDFSSIPCRVNCSSDLGDLLLAILIVLPIAVVILWTVVAQSYGSQGG